MVIYEYRCARCGNSTDLRYPMGKAPDEIMRGCIHRLDDEGDCGGWLKRVYSMPGKVIPDDRNFCWRSEQRREAEHLRKEPAWRQDEMGGFGNTRAGVLSLGSGRDGRLRQHPSRGPVVTITMIDRAEPVPSGGVTSTPGAFSPRQYMARLYAAMLIRSDREAVWHVCKALYKLQFGTGARKKRFGTDQILANIPIGKSHLDTIYSATSLREPELAVVDAGKLSEGAAAVGNYWYRRHKFHPQVRFTTRDTLMYGTGWLKAGWVHQDRPGRPDPAQAAALAQGAWSAAAGMAQSDPAYQMPDTGRLSAEAASWLAERTPPEVLASHPRWNRVSPWDVWVDPEAVSLDDARWVCQQVWEPVAAVRQNPEYDEAARATAVPTVMRVIDESSPHGGTANRFGYLQSYAYQGVGSHDQGRVAVMEMWDKEQGIVAKWARDASVFLLTKPMPYALPFEHTTMYELPDEFYGIGELEPIIGLQDELNEMVTIDIAHRRQQIAKYIAWEDVASDPEFKRLFKSSQIGGVVPSSGHPRGRWGCRTRSGCSNRRTPRPRFCGQSSGRSRT